MIYCGGIILCIIIAARTLYYLKPQSADGRLLIWKVSWQMIKDKPITGFGKGGFAANYLYYQAKYMDSPLASAKEKALAGNTHLAFNEPLRIAVEHGLFGLLIYLVLVIWLLIPPKKKNSISIICKSLLAGIITWGLFAYPDQVFSLLTFWVIGIALILNQFRTYYELPRNIYFQIAAIALYSFTIIFLSSQLLSRWQSYHKLYIHMSTNEYQTATEKRDMLISIKKEMESDISLFSLYYQAVRANSSDIELLYSIHFLESNFPSPGLLVVKGDFYAEKKEWKEAENAYKLAAAMMPSLQTPRGKLAFLYYKTERIEEARKIAYQILTEDIKVYGFDTFKLHRDLKNIFEDK